MVNLATFLKLIKKKSTSLDFECWLKFENLPIDNFAIFFNN